MFKKLSYFIVLSLISITLISCRKKKDYSDLRVEAPNRNIMTGAYDLDFYEMHNSVIDYLSSEATPFFFVKSGTENFEVDGSNEEKYISVRCVCLKGTTIEDVDLFLSMVLNGIASNASEQDYRFMRPSVGKSGEYTDFGTVFNTYELRIDAKNEDGTVLRNVSIKPGQSIPIEPRYIME